MQNKMTKGDALAWIYIGTSVYLAEQAIKRRDELLNYLKEEPLDIGRHQSFLMGLDRLKGLENGESKFVYDRVLEILIDNPTNPEVNNLVLKTGQWYSHLQKSSKKYTLEDLSKVQFSLNKYLEFKELNFRLKNDESGNFSEAARWIRDFDLSTFEDDSIKSRVVELKDSFASFFMQSLLTRIAQTPEDKELQSLLRLTLENVDRPDISQYEEFLVESLKYGVKNPHDQEFKEFLIFSLDKAPGIAGVDSLKIYNTVLDLFESSESQKGLRVLVLDVGRWHFSRKNWVRRKPKPEDEQQMQNDILMRLRD